MQKLLVKWLGIYVGGTLLSTASGAFLLTLGIYLFKTSPTLSDEVITALLLLFWWFFQLILIVTATVMLPVSFWRLRQSTLFGVRLRAKASSSSEDEGVDYFAMGTRMWLIFSLFFAMIAALLLSGVSFFLFDNAFQWLNIVSMYAVLVVMGLVALIGVINQCEHLIIEWLPTLKDR